MEDFGVVFEARIQFGMSDKSQIYVENQVNLMILMESLPSLKLSPCSCEKNFFLFSFRFRFCLIP
jgi:hypothetical protein